VSTFASAIADSGDLPSKYREAADEITQILVDAHEELENGPTEEHASRFAREEDGTVILDEAGDPVVELLYDDKMNPVMREHTLHFRHRTQGLHAYRYEVQDDGSCLAIYANDASGEIKMKAFPDIETASLWSPRDERLIGE